MKVVRVRVNTAWEQHPRWIESSKSSVEGL